MLSVETHPSPFFSRSFFLSHPRPLSSFLSSFLSPATLLLPLPFLPSSFTSLPNALTPFPSHPFFSSHFPLASLPFPQFPFRPLSRSLPFVHPHSLFSRSRVGVGAKTDCLPLITPTYFYVLLHSFLLLSFHLSLPRISLFDHCNEIFANHL